MTKDQFNAIISDAGGMEKLNTLHSANGGIYVINRDDRAGKYIVDNIDDVNDIIMMSDVADATRKAYLPIENVEAVFTY